VTSLPQAKLGSFDIRRKLGSGGMAEVFLAEKHGAAGTSKVLVLKRILPAYAAQRRFRDMFVEEALLATRLNHPNIVQVYEFIDHADDGLLLAMEYVEGMDLGRLFAAAKQQGRPVPPYVAAFIVAEAAKGLHYAHERRDDAGAPLGIVHRDVSPQNVLLSSEGVVKIADFGIAAANMFREEPGVLKGKFGYMSPEQARGERVDRRSDIYALGVVLYELLALRNPYGKLEDDDLLEAVRSSSFESPSAHQPDIPPELEAITMRALARSRDDRYQTARDMAGAVGRAILAKQELVDASSVESVLVQFLGRDAFPSPSEAPQPPQTLAAIPLGRTGGGIQTSRRKDRKAREVRHVAVLRLRIRGFDDLGIRLGGAGARRAMDRVRRTLDDIAYKRDAKWTWDDDGQGASTAVGLSMNASRAAQDAASLAIDVHESLAGASEDLPVPVTAAIGIVRGIAAGERDDEGNLVRHELQAPAPFLAELLSRETPLGKTFVAGGLFRLVRREFRWGDAPTLEVPEADERDAPRRMRLYALVRPLSREERAAEMALAPNDLVGRDAEKADLHAAYHHAVSAGVQRSSQPPVSGGGQRSSQPPASARSSFSSDSRPSLSGDLRPSLLPPDARIEVQIPELPLGPRSDAEPSSPGGSLRPASVPPPPGVPSTSPPGRDVQARPQGSGHLVARAIVGEVGIGKTALVSTFLSELPRDARVLAVECSPARGELPFATLCSIIRDATGVGTDHSIEEASAVFRGVLDAFVRGPTGHRIAVRLAEIATGKQAPEAEEDVVSFKRALLVSGVRYLLGALAVEQPLVLVIDGMQWCDRQSLELLHEMLKRTERMPILVLLVTRPDEHIGSYLEGMVRIDLRGLTAEQQIRLVQARLGVRDGVASVCGELVPRVAGNPFFLLEMIDAMLERGALEIVDRGDSGHELRRLEAQIGRTEALPSTLEQLIGDRLRELPSEEHDVVDWLAVAHGPLLETDLLSLTRLPSDEAIMRLCARGLCDRKGGSLDFRHPFARDVAYVAIERSTRARMHRLLGEHLRATPLARGLSAALVARHLARGEAPVPAAELYLEAANAARATNQVPLAQRYYQRALSLLPAGDPRRMVAHEALETIYRHLGRRRERRAHLVALRKHARDSALARWASLAMARTARYELDEGFLARALPVAQKAAEMARAGKQSSLEVDALTTLSEILRDLGDIQGAIDAAERALRVADRGALGARARAEVVRAKGVLLRYTGRVEEAVECYAESIAVFRMLGARRSEARAKVSLAYAMFVMERYEDTIALGLDAVQIDRSMGGRFQVAKTLSNVGQAYARLGDLTRGLAFLRRAREAHERYADQDSRTDTLLVTAIALLEGGDIDAAHTLCLDAGALTAVTGSIYDVIHEHIVRALLARHTGDAQRAIEHAAQARQLAESQAMMSFHLYATSIEAAARVDAGELHTGVLLARTALGAVEATTGCEYGIEVRALGCEALRRASPIAAEDAYQRCAAHVRKVASFIRLPEHQQTFFSRPIVDRILFEAEGRSEGSHRPSRPAEEPS